MKNNLKDYAAIPFWSWNDKLEPEALAWQIRWMKEKGLGGFIMHARSGLVTEYLSEEWMKCIEACTKEARDLGMKAWVYDENGWPSGFVGGELLKDEKNRDKYIVTTEGEYQSDATVSYLLTDTQLVRVFDGAEEGQYLNLYIHTATSTADILNPEVVDQFLSLTHDAYEEYFGGKLSDVVEGFFTDEPQYHRWNTPFTDMVAKYFEEEYGQDILDVLGLLFVEKEGYRQFRYRYWRAMQSLMLQNFAEKLYNWCEKHEVKLTGHYMGEDTLGCQMISCGGVMPFYEFEHIPGIDWLGTEIENSLSPKQVASVSAQLGKNQILTETFAGCGWDVTPIELRRIAAFQYVNGANTMCHHLLPYSERGTRKYDYPAHFSDVNPWVREYFQCFNDYFTELGRVLGEGKQYVNVAMLHPIRSAYFDYKRMTEESMHGIEALEINLSKDCEILSSRAVDFHFLDETLLAKYGFVEGTHIGCGKCTYDYLVLPHIITMDSSTQELLKTYISQGGKVLILGEKPCFLEGEEYVYDYLESNVTLEEIVEAQKFCVQNYDKDVFCAYRVFENEEYIYVLNRSLEEKKTQIFKFKGSNRECSIVLNPGEDKLFQIGQVNSGQNVSQKKFDMQFRNAKVEVKENYLPIDMISYSKDGHVFSESYPCAALFHKLLKEQYKGPLFLKYEFVVEQLPSQLIISSEKSNDIEAWLNGELIEETSLREESYMLKYDVAHMVRKGVNQFVKKIDWFQSEDVYFALFGENVTESLRNCIVYNTELQPIELTGDFGVYVRDGYLADTDTRFVKGKKFYVGELPGCVSEPSTEGFSFFAGEMTLSQNIFLDSTDVVLQITGDYSAAEVFVNGETAGNLFFERELDISHVACVGSNEVKVKFILSNRNRMGPHHSGKDEIGLISPWTFLLTGEWDGGQCDHYDSDYSIKKIFYREDD